MDKPPTSAPDCDPVWGEGGGGTLIVSYIRRLRSFLRFQIFEFQYFWGFQKNEYFLGYENFVGIFWVIPNWSNFRGYFYVF